MIMKNKVCSGKG